MEVPLALIILGAVALYGIVFMVVLGKVAGREKDRFRFLSNIHGQDNHANSENEPLAPQRGKIFVFDPAAEEEEEKKQDKKVS